MLNIDSTPSLVITDCLATSLSAEPDEKNHSDVEISVVVPCYDEEVVIPELYRRVSCVCQQIGITYELILINDGSRDQTWPLMVELSRKDPCIICVNLSRNHGHQIALTAGLSFSRGRRILVLDADLQDPPELLKEMLPILDAGADVVFGRRRRRNGESNIKRATASVFYRLMGSLSDVAIPFDAGDFRLLSRRALDVLLAMPERHRFVRGMISWIGLHQEAFPYDRQPRYAGTTKYSWRKMMRLAVDAITSSSLKPLAFSTWIGATTGFLSLLILFSSAVIWIGGGFVCGWVLQLAVVTFMGSLQLTALGIQGEYLGRMYEQSRGRPLFVIDQVVRGPNNSKQSEFCKQSVLTL